MGQDNITAPATESGIIEQVPDREQMFLSQVNALVSPPDVYLRATELVESDDSSAADIAEVISCDPNLTVRLLALVNSSYFNRAQPVDTVSRAISVLGTRELYNLVIAVSAVSTFSKIPNALVTMNTFWRHSVYTGLLARALAKRCHVLKPDRLFVAGLLHDIGSLVMYHQAPDQCAQHLLLAAGDEELVYQAEQENFGFTHASLGGRLAGDWHLPDVLCAAISAHHQPELGGDALQEASLVYLANRLANAVEEGNFTGKSLQEDSGVESFLTTVALSAEDLEQALSEVVEQFPSAVGALVG